MGVIYGYISLTDKPVDHAITEAMRKANSFWEPDGDGLWQDERAAMGSLIMFNTPEAIFEKQPIHFEDGHKVMVATARIDNRDDLCRAFNIPLSARDIYPDSFYIRLAYEKWGEACPDHLIGDWSFAVWDKVNRKLFVARDHHGIMACYYYKGPDFFVFSSSLKGILCLPQVPKKVNEYKIAQILVNWNEGGPPTCYEDIFRLPPSHTITLKDGKVSTNRYWYLEHTPEVRLKNDQEYIDMFRDLYTEAVRCRLRSYRPVGATLSGGLDSGSVCILASQELAKYGKRLPAFTAVPLYEVPWPKNRIGDEGPLALALAEKLGNVDVTLCRAENISPLEGIEKMMEVHDQPDFAYGNAYWISDILMKSKKYNIKTLLIGQGGNSTVSWHPHNNSMKFYIRALIFRINFSLGFWDRKFLINRNLLKEFCLKKQMKSYKLRPYFLLNLSESQHKFQVLKPGQNTIGSLWYEDGLANNVEVRDPTIDYNILMFTSNIPVNSKFYSCRKLLLKLFNEFPLSNQKRGVQAIDLLPRIDINKLKSELNTNEYFLSNKRLNKNLNQINNRRNILQLLRAITITKFANKLRTCIPISIASVKSSIPSLRNGK
jgi:asparagine synthase (glutamine-hydrolysing)